MAATPVRSAAPLLDAASAACWFPDSPTTSGQSALNSFQVIPAAQNADFSIILGRWYRARGCPRELQAAARQTRTHSNGPTLAERSAIWAVGMTGWAAKPRRCAAARRRRRCSHWAWGLACRLRGEHRGGGRGCASTSATGSSIPASVGPAVGPVAGRGAGTVAEGSAAAVSGRAAAGARRVGAPGRSRLRRLWRGLAARLGRGRTRAVPPAAAPGRPGGG